MGVLYVSLRSKVRLRTIGCIDMGSAVPTTPACTWWNRPEKDNSSGKLESTHPSRTSVKSDQVFFGVESVIRVSADSLLIRAAATSTSGTLNDLTTDLIMANNNNNNMGSAVLFILRSRLLLYSAVNRVQVVLSGLE